MQRLIFYVLFFDINIFLRNAGSSESICASSAISVFSVVVFSDPVDSAVVF